jgi:hypothetical protein
MKIVTRLRKQLMELTGISIVSLNELFYVGLYVRVRYARHYYYYYYYTMNFVDSSGAPLQNYF